MIFYKGTNYEKLYPSMSDFIWISSEKCIAEQYGKNLFKINIDFNKINIASISNLEDAAALLDCDLDEVLYNPTKDFIDVLKFQNIDAYFLDSYFENFCLFNNKLIKSFSLIENKNYEKNLN